jgi:hypothetical protein
MDLMVHTPKQLHQLITNEAHNRKNPSPVDDVSPEDAITLDDDDKAETERLAPGRRGWQRARSKGEIYDLFLNNHKHLISCSSEIYSCVCEQNHRCDRVGCSANIITYLP